MRAVIGALASLLLIGLAGCTDDDNDWNVGCTNGVCPIVNGKGKIIWFDGSQKKITGTGQLPGKVTAPVKISCSTVSGKEGCVAVDSAGQIWIGPPRAGTNYDLITTIPK